MIIAAILKQVKSGSSIKIAMTKYVALLRGINVGGHKLIKMQELVRIFTNAGCKNVRTFQQAGNVIFESRSSNQKALTKKIERALEKDLGYHVAVILRSLDELQHIVSRDRFKKFANEKEVMLCVVFLAERSQNNLPLPIISTTENVEIFDIADGAAFAVVRRKKNGWFGYPHAVVEKTLGVVGTTRQWKSLQKIVKAAESGSNTKEV
jgi:uncharacterized protein (DUF1697 family)